MLRLASPLFASFAFFAFPNLLRDLEVSPVRLRLDEELDEEPDEAKRPCSSRLGSFLFRVAIGKLRLIQSSVVL